MAITWKGPRLDAAAKARREIELPLNAPAVTAVAESEARASHAVPGGPRSTLGRWTELLEALGFRRVREVAKRRRLATVAWDGDTVEVAIDRVIGLGDFVEFELRTDATGIAAAAARVETLARALGCGRAEPRSYLELLLASAENEG